MEDTQIIYVLNVAFAKIQTYIELLRQEMQCIKRLCLSLRYGRDILGPRKGLKASETSPRILDQNPRRCRVCLGLVIKQRPDVVWKLRISKSGSRQLAENGIRLHSLTHRMASPPLGLG
jgi:hypothetical protein